MKAGSRDYPSIEKRGDMKGKRLAAFILIAAILTACPGADAKQVFKVQLFFGLSIPGGGAVSLVEWEEFRDRQIVKSFEGFDEMDTVGYYKGAAERSKVLTILVSQDEMHKVVELAKSFATQFHQESVMLLTLPVVSWQFIKGTPALSHE